ncbi:MAG: DUF4465 domain-containing protein [Phycisphaerae bacterium]|nr:DUF4465 domain-containing protein [Phycisphaerae bacterium]
MCTKIIASLMMILSVTVVVSASVATFDDNPLALNSHWGGAGSGQTGFVSGTVSFYHNDSGWSWDGFVYSNMTDVSTAGYENQFSAYTGSGADGSSNYAVSALNLDWSGNYAVIPISINFINPCEVSGAYFTNTTYAYLAMKNGEGPAVKFDSQDWFKLTITGKDASNLQTGAIDFYLADNGQIVDKWEYIDLSGLGVVASIEFSLSSSDTGDFGMNTPAYFAMDNLIIPEPASLVLMGLSALALSRKRI